MAQETQPEITDDQLRDIAAQLDAGKLDPQDEVDITPEATAGQEEIKPEGSVSPEKEVTQESQVESPQAEAQAEVDYKAEYERLKKEEDRKERSWKRLNEEKEALAQLKATTRPDETRIAGDQFSAEEYEQYAEKLVEEGNGADARKAMTRAKQIRQQSFQDKWQQSIQEAIDDEPDLANRESELAKTVQSILKDPKWGSFKTAVDLAKAKKLEGSVPGLMGEIETHKKEIERLNKAMEIGGKAGLHKREAPKKFDDMSMDEASEYLRRRATEADSDLY